jgi:hypothetical protein
MVKNGGRTRASTAWPGPFLEDLLDRVGIELTTSSLPWKENRSRSLWGKREIGIIFRVFRWEIHKTVAD